MIQHLNAKGRVQEFHVKHGAEAYELDGWLWYCTGAHREAGEMMGALVEPPRPDTEQSKYELATWQLKFHQAKLNHLVRKFDAIKGTDGMGGVLIPNDQAAALKQLTDLKVVIQSTQQALNKAQEVVDSTSIGKARKSAQHSPQEEMVRLNDWREKLQKVRV